MVKVISECVRWAPCAQLARPGVCSANATNSTECRFYTNTEWVQGSGRLKKIAILGPGKLDREQWKGRRRAIRHHRALYLTEKKLDLCLKTLGWRQINSKDELFGATFWPIFCRTCCWSNRGRALSISCTPWLTEIRCKALFQLLDSSIDPHCDQATETELKHFAEKPRPSAVRFPLSTWPNSVF